MGHLVVRDSTLRSHYESVERVIAAMRTRLDQPMSLRSMARIACASPYHFNRTFRQVTGVPPSQFLYAMRLDTARRLLMHTQKKRSEEHTSELQSRSDLVCRLLLEKKKKKKRQRSH